VVASSGGTVTEVNHYYPFGSVFASSGNMQPYKYNGKELDTKKGLNWYDYGARHYDATLGRWLVVDPLAEKMGSWSPYAYCYSNPLKFVDVDGKYGESIWDISSLLIGVKSFSDNIKSGNISNAIVDGVGIVFDAVAVALPVVPGGIGAGIKAVRATDDVADVVTTANKSNNVMKNRVKLRKGTKEAVKDLAPKTGEGLFVDPNTNLPIEKGQEVFGHKKGQEWSKYKNDPVNKNKTRKEVIEDQNNPKIYQIEDKKSNASHKYEEKWK
jgi:RHS repeat-associated protein